MSIPLNKMPKAKSKFTPPKGWLSRKKVDGVSRGFEDLAQNRLPELFGFLEIQIKNAIPLSIFAKDGNGPATILKLPAFVAHLKCQEPALKKAIEHTASLKETDAARKNKEFAGVYVMVSGKRPFYVGISRNMIFRLRTHVRTLEHHTASLLFNLVRDQTNHLGRREELDFTTIEARGVQTWLRGQKVAILPLACPVERYAFELYASMKLMTGKWNTFETH